MRKIIFSKSSIRTIEKLKTSDLDLLDKIIERIEQLAFNPLMEDIKSIKGFKGYYRARVQKYRIVYNFNKEVINIFLIEMRDRVYKNLK